MHGEQVSSVLVCRTVEFITWTVLIVSCTNITIPPTNLNIILFVGMDVYSNPSKFQ